MDYEDIQTFLMIVETGSISRASDRLFLSQSSVSQRLQHLEDVLGVRLLLRRKGIKNVELTKAGKAFISIARRYTELMNEADALKRERIRPYLSIGATDTLTTNLFLPLMQALVRDYPDTDYKFRVKLSEAIYDDVETGKLDVGLVMDYYKRRDVLVRPVYTEPMVVISRSELPSQDGVVAVSALSKEKEIRQWWGADYIRWHEEVLDPDTRSGLNVNTVSLLISMLQIDQTWSIAPTSVAAEIARTCPVFTCKIAENPPERVIYLITPRLPKSGSEAMLAIFSARLEEHLAQMTAEKTDR